MPLNLYTSNRMEVLVDTLATTLSKPLASVFTKEVIVVPVSYTHLTLPTNREV